MPESNAALVRPSVQYEKEFLDMAREWAESGLDDAPWYTQPGPDFLAMLGKLDGFSRGIGLPEGFVPNSTFWLVGEGRRVLGALNLRHRLNDFFLSFGGQVGYAIRPGARGRGYGKEILRLGLIEAGKMEMEKVLVCCFRENAASARVIEGNGGVLENERECEGKIIRRYWIELQRVNGGASR